MQLTPNFTLAEFTRSAKAQALGLDNTPTAKALANLQHTAEMLERVRAHLGVPITIRLPVTPLPAEISQINTSDSQPLLYKARAWLESLATWSQGEMPR